MRSNNQSLTSKDQRCSGAQQQRDVAIVITFKAEQCDRHDRRDERQREREGEEKLHGNVESRQQIVVNDVILLFENPHATVETNIVEAMNVLEVAEARRPQSCESTKQSENRF